MILSFWMPALATDCEDNVREARQFFRLLIVIGLATLTLWALFLAFVIVTGGKVKAATAGLELIARQHRPDACLLGAVATHLNYLAGQRLYTSEGLALAYRAKYNGREDWAKDGNTSHQAQVLAQYAPGLSGAQVGKLTEPSEQDGRSDGTGRLGWLVWLKRYPILFLDGPGQQHAIVAVGFSADGKRVVYADPLDGLLHELPLTELYARLEPQKWYFYAS